MKLRTLYLLVGFAALFPWQAFAAVSIDQAMPNRIPADHPAIEGAGPAGSGAASDISRQLQDEETLQLMAQDRTMFEENINLADLRLLAIWHNDQLKILDSWARQTLETITGHKTIKGQDPLYSTLDMTFRPEVWATRNIIFVQAVPIRERLGALVAGESERLRIRNTGLISPQFFQRPEVQSMLQSIAQSDVRLSPAVGKIYVAYDNFDHIGGMLLMLPPLSAGQAWQHPLALRANDPDLAGKLPPDAKPLPGYSTKQAQNVVLAAERLSAGWRQNDLVLANEGVRELAEVLPAINPQEYPSVTKRKVEYIYNISFNGTLIGVFLYLTALTLFMVMAIGGVKKVRTPALLCLGLAIFSHAAFMGVRWWLAGRIPIQNQFESMMGSALLGCTAGFLLELWRKNGLFGMALSFVGFMAMTACFVVPFVIGTNIGEHVSTVAGILSDYWLYIHVNIVISSYALIAASFCLGTVYLITRAVCKAQPRPEMAGAHVGGESTGLFSGDADFSATSEQYERRRKLLESLDAANVVILQMALWALGTGIICGAVWADHSWGRPWGWDPKETFALVTWIVYLVIVHVRFVTPKNRALWTAWLSIAGFGVMLFNWIGVNFFLVGLHSYA